MKKIYLSALALTMIGTGLYAQSASSSIETLPESRINKNSELYHSPAKANVNLNKDLQEDIWTDDFSDETTWTFGHDEDLCTLDWEIGTGLTMQGSYADGPITSTTASNGYAMLDSYYYNEETGNEDVESAWMTTSESIDLSADDFVTLEFESYFRIWNINACYVVISTNNTDWPTLNVDYDASSNPNVFSLYDYLNVNQATANPEVTQINISEVAGGESTVWIRFHWTAETTIYGSGYGWFVDDVKIFPLPDNDMSMNYSVISHIGDGNEYGRVPANQVYDDMYFGASNTNTGAMAQTNVMVEMDIVDDMGADVMNITSDSEASVAPGENFDWEVFEPVDFVSGLYTATFTLTSDEEMDGDLFDDNVSVRNFEITDDMYSLDGIGVDPVSTLSSIGTANFAGSEDEFFIGLYYDLIMDENPVYGAEIQLSASTVAGGSVFIHLYDTASVYDVAFDDPLVSSDEYFITEDDVDNGYARIYFDEVEMMDADAYFLVIELYSEDNAYDIQILDDLTTPQPSISSLIHIAGTTVIYSNGNAVALRMLTAAPNAVNEIEKVAVLSQNVPNPANERTTVSFDLLSNQDVTIRLTDMLGKVVIEEKMGNLMPGAHNYTFELNGLKAGTYHYSIVTDNGSLSKSMQIIK